MKVLFLDIDGVCNCAKSNFKDAMWPIDLYMAFLVGRLLDRTGAKLVLSSSWKNAKEGIGEVSKRIYPVFDVTPYVPDEVGGAEIAAWLSKHPEVEKYAILDDDTDMLDEQAPNFFKTSWQTGITEDIALAVENHLGLSN